jgi:divinyl chlorophyllide a 8-vinyl-reductase
VCALQEFAGANVVFGDVTNLESLRQTAFNGPVDVVVSCLASRTGGKKDSWDVDYQVGTTAAAAAATAGIHWDGRRCVQTCC